MMQDGEPKYIRSDGVTEINWEDGPESGCTGIAYEGGRPPVVVDGSPDEVFKALFNPPETLLKAEVADVLGRAHSSLSGMYGHGEVMAARRAMEAVAKALGLKVRE